MMAPILRDYKALYEALRGRMQAPGTSHVVLRPDPFCSFGLLLLGPKDLPVLFWGVPYYSNHYCYDSYNYYY